MFVLGKLSPSSSKSFIAARAPAICSLLSRESFLAAAVYASSRALMICCDRPIAAATCLPVPNLMPAEDNGLHVLERL